MWIIPSHTPLHLSQQVPKLSIIDLHPIIKVKADALVSVVTQLFVKGVEFGLLFEKSVSFFFELAAMGGGSSFFNVGFQLINASRYFALQWNDVFGPHT